MACLVLAGLVVYLGSQRLAQRRRRDELTHQAVRLQDRQLVRSTSGLEDGFSFRWSGFHGQVRWVGGRFRLTVAMGPMPDLVLDDPRTAWRVSGAHAMFAAALFPAPVRDRLVRTRHLRRLALGVDCVAEFDALWDDDLAAVLSAIQRVQVTDPWGSATEALALVGDELTRRSGSLRGQAFELQAHADGLRASFRVPLGDLYLAHIDHASGPAIPIDPVTDLLVVGRGRAGQVVQAHREAILALVHGNPGTELTRSGLALKLATVPLGDDLVAEIEAAVTLLQALAVPT